MQRVVLERRLGFVATVTCSIASPAISGRANGAVQVGAAKRRPWVCSPISVHRGSLKLNRWRAAQAAAVRTVSASRSGFRTGPRTRRTATTPPSPARIPMRKQIETAMAAQHYTPEGTAPQATLRFLAAPTDINWGG